MLDLELSKKPILVAFRIMPENPMHDDHRHIVPGDLRRRAHLLYQWMDGKGARSTASAFGRKNFNPGARQNDRHRFRICIVLLAFRINDRRVHEKFVHANVSFGTLKGEEIEGGVTDMLERKWISIQRDQKNGYQ
jgi:hypothetical protein